MQHLFKWESMNILMIYWSVDMYSLLVLIIMRIDLSWFRTLFLDLFLRQEYSATLLVTLSNQEEQKYIEDITWPRVDMNFICECSTRYLTSERSERVRYRVEHEKIKFISTSGHVIFCLLYKHRINSCEKGAIYYVTITTVISSRVKITCYLHMWRYDVFAGKLTWYFTGVYIIKRISS